MMTIIAISVVACVVVVICIALVYLAKDEDDYQDEKPSKEQEDALNEMIFFNNSHLYGNGSFMDYPFSL